MENEDNKADRRKFLKFGVLAAGLTVAGGGLQKVLSEEKDSGKKVKVLTTDGQVVEVDDAHIKAIHSHCKPSTPAESREGVPGKKFVMVIDLSRCAHELKCQHSCQKYHHLSGMNVWLKVFKMQEGEHTALVWDIFILNNRITIRHLSIIPGRLKSDAKSTIPSAFHVALTMLLPFMLNASKTIPPKNMFLKQQKSTSKLANAFGRALTIKILAN